MSDFSLWLRKHWLDLAFITVILSGIAGFFHLKGRFDELDVEKVQKEINKQFDNNNKLLEAQYYLLFRNDRLASNILDEIETSDADELFTKYFAYELHCRLLVTSLSYNSRSESDNIELLKRKADAMVKIDTKYNETKRFYSYHWKGIGYIYDAKQNNFNSKVLNDAKIAIEESLSRNEFQTRDRFNLTEIYILLDDYSQAEQTLKYLKTRDLMKIEHLVYTFLFTLVNTLNNTIDEKCFKDNISFIKGFKPTDPGIYETSVLMKYIESRDTINELIKLKAIEIINAMQIVTQESFK